MNNSILKDAYYVTALFECDPFYSDEKYPNGAIVLRVAKAYIELMEFLIIHFNYSGFPDKLSAMFETDEKFHA